MSQIVHIFRKDARQLRLEILATLTILVLFGIFEPRSWNDFVVMTLEGMTSMAFAILLYIAWGILIIRLIQTDRLPGLNQFWTTRPVEWWKLLAAKGLFLLVFLYAPLILLQMVLLHLGGFAVAPNLPLILLDMFLLSAVLVLPLMSLAAVTSSFGQTMLVLLGTLVLFVLVLYVAFALGRNLEPRYLTSLQLGIVVAILSSAVVYQYRWRATRNTIVLCAVTAVLLICTQWFLPGSSLAVVGYDRPAQGAPVSIAIYSGPQPGGHGFNLEKPDVPTIILYVPLVVSSIAPGTSFSLEGQRVHLEGPDGYGWESQWENANSVLTKDSFANSDGSYAVISIPRRVYDRLGGGTVRVRMEFAVAQLQEMPAFQTFVSAERVMVPGLGSCAFSKEWGTIGCRSVFGQPADFAVSTFRPRGRCEASPSNLPTHGQIGHVSTRESRMTLGISPVTVSGVRFESQVQASGPLCVGAPISYVGKRIVQRLQMQTPTATVSLKDLAGF
jgi:hypothetical protein